MLISDILDTNQINYYLMVVGLIIVQEPVCLTNLEFWLTQGNFYTYMSIGLEGTVNGFGIFQLFDIAWVHQAIESHAVLIPFHLSTDPDIDKMRDGCLCQADKYPIPVFVICPNIHAYIRTYIHMHTPYTHANKCIHSVGMSQFCQQNF